MVRIRLILSAICFITQYFTLNINILHADYVCIKRKWGLYELWDMFMIRIKKKKKSSRRIIAYVAKKLMDNDIFLVIAKNIILLWLSQ